MKRVLSIQDLSCLGKCSLTVALPVLSAMGCNTAVLPTALLSTHTAFDSPYCKDLTQELLPIARHWKKVGATFDVIGVGYLASPEQADTVTRVLEDFSGKVVVDPVMGDHGKLYAGISPAHTDALAKLCRKANVLLPNVTEACLLTGIPYAENPDRAYYEKMLQAMQLFGAETVILTGVSLASGQTGIMGYDGQKVFTYQTQELPRRCHGTGDLFAAVVMGAIASGKTPQQAAVLAADFVCQVIRATKDSSPFGVEFEAQLPWLWEKL